jgi:hypothetical protein
LRQVNAQVVGFLLVRRTPHQPQELPLTDQPARCADQFGPQRPLGRRESHGGAVDGDLLGDQIDGEIIRVDDRVMGFCRPRRCIPRSRASSSPMSNGQDT